MCKSDMEKKERQRIYVITIHIFVFSMVFINNTYLIFNFKHLFTHKHFHILIWAKDQPRKDAMILIENVLFLYCHFYYLGHLSL